MAKVAPEPRFFPSQKAFRAWLRKHHAAVDAQWVGLSRVGASGPGLTYKQALDEALCFGWIDGVRRSIDAERWMIRFTPRKPGSIWSLVNIQRADELEAEGLLEPAGRAAFAQRDRERAESYSYERATAGFAPELEAEFRRHARAWKYFDAQPPYYRRLCTHWVVSAKQETTRQRRLATLISHSQAGERLPQTVSPKRGSKA